MTTDFRAPARTAEREPAVQLYSIRDRLANNMRGALTDLLEIGVTRVEAFGFGSETTTLVDLANSAGLEVASTHANFLSDPGAHPDLDKLFETARSAGISTVIEPMLPRERFAHPDDIEAVADALNRAAAIAARHSVRVGYHNHDWELSTRHAETSALEVLHTLLDHRVVFELDAFWADAGGVPAADLLSRLGSRVALLHVKDGGHPLSRETQRPAGRGDLDIVAVLAAAPHADRVVEFDLSDESILSAIAESIAFVRASDESRR
ncbi:sugar phosphate isomerase/epimerase family protein [Subtercola vilae]|uniref:Sugar phosphate isomerase/epimerase n=1 Tax=Subtercola vilae TaxID=2056433 RepID=A0A4T2BXU6_9MICO|nr:TIM barrel protein [Subtercola vilae]TIH36645.1 sugar phosphate isomerase/epimerase [Subtercola vilae]